MSHQRPKIKRLKSKILINKIFEEGKTIRKDAFQLVYIQDKSLSCHFFGVSASKRSLKKAVDRNKMKRMMREALRQITKHQWSDQNKPTANVALMLIYSGGKLPQYKVMQEKINLILERLKNEI